MKGVVYVMPRGYISINRCGSPLFEILPEANGSYVFRMGLYFPTNGIKTGRLVGSEHLFSQSCPYDKVKDYLSSHRNLLEDNSSSAITLSPLPVQKIRVRIPELEEIHPGSGTAYIGNDETSMLHYQGDDHLLSFHLANKQERDNFLDKIRGEIGVTLLVDYFFTAQSSEGVVSVNLDASKIASNLEASMAGKFPPAKIVGEAEVRSAIAAAIESMKLDIYVEGKDNSFDQLAQSLLTQMLASGNKVLAENPPTPTIPPAQTGKPGAASAPADASTTPPSPSASTKNFDIKALISALYKAQNIKINYQKMGQTETRIHSTSIILRTPELEGDNPTIGVFSTDGEKPLFQNVQTGVKYMISPRDMLERNVTYSSSRQFYDHSALNRLENLSQHFPLLNTANLSWIKEGKNVQGRQEAYMWEGWIPNVMRSYYSWGEESTVPYKPEFVVKPNADLSPENVPLLFRFTAVGAKRLKLSDLMKETKNWSGGVDPDTGVIYFTPKRNLGALWVQNTTEVPYVSIWPTRHIQEKRSYYILGDSLLQESKSPLDHEETVPTKEVEVRLIINTQNESLKPTSLTETIKMQSGVSGDGMLELPTEKNK